MNISEIIKRIKAGDDPIIKQLHKKNIYDDDETEQERLAAHIRSNPKYKQVLVKLEELEAKKTYLQKQIAKIDIDIDSCLVLLDMDIKKERIDGGKNEE